MNMGVKINKARARRDANITAYRLGQIEPTPAQVKAYEKEQQALMNAAEKARNATKKKGKDE